MMMAVYRAAGGWPALQRALPLLAELERRGGMEQLVMFVIYGMFRQQPNGIRNSWTATLRIEL